VGERPICPWCGADNPQAHGEERWDCRICGRSFAKNPVEKKKFDLDEISEYWLGYIAGIIDGEGSLSCYKAKTKKQKRKFYWRFRLRIGNTKYQLFKKLWELLGKKSFPLQKYIRKGNRKPMYSASLKHQLIKKLLPKLKLIIKERNRLLVIEGLSILGEHWENRRSGYTPNDERLEEIFLELKKLNRRGKID